MIQVARDIVGIEMAAYEMLEEAFEDEVAVATRKQATAKRTLSPGYYSKAAYLFELRSLMRLGIKFDMDTMLARDLDGVQALERAERKFNNAHQQCQHCGKRMNKFSTWCWSCKKGEKPTHARISGNSGRS